ncbi:ATP-binding protein [Corynebacterium variabile]|uniref:Uncharacterized protein n=1 Tax=Corynebacterium variabile TaxID=1727 RepID=A0A0X2NRS5_9CORY|nr:ATP-binding protein [Corynebacterium variabile]MDN6657741.1 ATP-binding protein [Acidipropionibacterium jensenii]CUU67411.1 hypothetical protein CVAR292_02773 [Corynebacterium variabile]
METIRTADVFSPGLDPKYTYNPRDDFSLEDKLETAIDDGGAIVSVTGPTKTGKTVLLKRVIDDPAWLDGGSIGSIEDFWSNLADVLGMTLDSSVEQSKTANHEASAGVNFEFVSADAGGGQGYSASYTKTHVNSLPIAVKRFLNDNTRTIVIDDFHFIDNMVQKKIVRELKPMVFDGQRVVVASITHHWNDVTEAVEDMGARIFVVEIPKWTDEELDNIAVQGFPYLNVEAPSRESVANLVKMSYGSPHIMQHLCRGYVRTINGVKKTEPALKTLHDPTSWEEFFSGSSIDDSEKWFDKLISGPKVKGTPRKTRKIRGGTTTDIYGLTLMAISETGPKLSITLSDIMEEVKALGGVGQNTTLPSAQEVARVLRQMTKIAMMRSDGEVPDEETLDKEIEEDDEFSGFSGMEPVVEFREDENFSIMTIADPFFAYYLRWGKKARVQREGSKG